MREDMARVLVGRPRTGARLRTKRRKEHQLACRRFDESPQRESMSRSRGTKCLNENLSPLQRYLRSQVGRPWDDGAWRQLRRIDAIWYALRLSSIPESAARRASTRDCVLRASLAELLRDRDGVALKATYGRPGVYACAKRQLGKRELRRIEALPRMLERGNAR